MLDRKFIVENAELVQAELHQPRRHGRRRPVRRAGNPAQGPCRPRSTSSTARPTRSPSRSARPRTPAEREARKEEGRQLREQTAEAAGRTRRGRSPSWTRIHRSIPNLSHPDAPVGVDDKANLELFRGKTPLPEFDFEPLDHVELAEKLDLIDFEAGGRRGRPRVLLPQERRRAAGAGPAALRPRAC